MRRLRLLVVLALPGLFGYGKGPLPPPGESEDKTGSSKCARVIYKSPGDG